MNDFQITKCDKCGKWHPRALTCVNIALQEQAREAFDEWFYAHYLEMRMRETIMLTLKDVVDKFYQGKTYRRIRENGGFEQLTPKLPLLMHEYRYTVTNREGEFVEWSTLAMEFVMDPNSGIGQDSWTEI